MDNTRSLNSSLTTWNYITHRFDFDKIIHRAINPHLCPIAFLLYKESAADQSILLSPLDLQAFLEDIHIQFHVLH